MGLLDRFKKDKQTEQVKNQMYTKLFTLMQTKQYDNALALHEKFFDENHEADLYT